MDVRVLMAACALVAGGCASRELDEKPMTAEEMPVSFDAPDLASAERNYHRAYDSSNGTDVRTMTVTGSSSFAVVRYISITGGYLFRERSTRSWVQTGMSDKFAPVWAIRAPSAAVPHRLAGRHLTSTRKPIVWA